MKVAVDSPRVLEMKNNTKALSFTLVQADAGAFQALPGFRIMDGLIHPPCVLRKRQWIPLYAASDMMASQIYAALVKKDWTTEFALPPLEDEARAVSKLLLTFAIAARVAPNCLV